MKTVFNSRFFRYFIIFLLAESIPLAWLLPARLAWENGLLEILQIAILLVGFFYACLIWGKSHKELEYDATRSIILRHMTLIATPIWLLCAGREISWGATLLSPEMAEASEPSFSSRHLWYHPAIKPLVLSTVFLLLFFCARWRLVRPVVLMLKQRIFPWFDLSLVLIAGLIATAAEGNLPFRLAGPESFHLALEEFSEVCCYLALLLLQSTMFNAVKILKFANTEIPSLSQMSK